MMRRSAPGTGRGARAGANFARKSAVHLAFCTGLCYTIL